MARGDSPAVVWIGPRAADGAVVGAGGHPVAIFSADTAQPHRPVRTALSLEARTGVRRRWGAASVRDVVAAFGKEIRQAARRADAVLPYTMDEALPALVGDTGAKLLGPAPRLRHWLDDKHAALRVFDDAGLPTLAYREMSVRQLPSLAVTGDTGRRLVVQIPRASGGKGTHFVRTDEESLRRLASRLGAGTVLVTDFEEGSYSLNAHVAVVPGSVLVGPMSVQLVGITSCTTHAAAYCGNDFATMADVGAGVVTRAREITTRWGESLAARGYRGIAGLDLLVTARPNGIFPVDLNPRLQASTRALALAERAADAGPGFVDLAVGAELGVYGREDLDRYAAPDALAMTQLVFYNRSSLHMSRRPGAAPTTAIIDGWSLTGLAPAGVRVESGAVLATATQCSSDRGPLEVAAQHLVGSAEERYEAAQ
ncbi:hypothetical protein OHA02_39065 [Streptomyces phaeochromogenes]|nr:hypothetical protein [Streptomyces phaeochromogenes]